MKVVWTKTAQQSLVKTTDFILEVWNEDIENRFLIQLDYRISQIRENPELAPTLKGSSFRQVKIHQTTSLFYKVYPNYLKILLIWDNRQDPNNLLKSITDIK